MGISVVQTDTDGVISGWQRFNVEGYQSLEKDVQGLESLIKQYSEKYQQIFVYYPQLMARGPKKHLKKIAAPKAWMLEKLGGIFTTRPSQGPHKLRESLPLSILLIKRLQYAQNGRQVTLILNDKENGIKVDARNRRDKGFPVGIMDVVEIVKTKEFYRCLYDVKGRFVLKALDAKEAGFKLLKVTRKAIGPNKIPYIVTHDARTIRFPHPEIEVGDTVKYDINNGKILEWVKNDAGNTCYVTGGNNIGRVGQLQHVERHIGGYDIVHVKDANGKTFATRKDNIFIIGAGKKPLISLPKENGIALTILEERKRKMSA